MAVTKTTKTLIRVDRNKTQYFEVTEPCFKCGGTGYIPYYSWNDSGICYDCNGTGAHTYKEKIMTPEYEAKLEAKRRAKWEAKLAEEKKLADSKNAEFFAKNGFDANGKTFILVGNTYDVKEQIKELGGRWMSNINCWICPTKCEFDGVKVIEADASDLYFQNIADAYDWRNYRFNHDTDEKLIAITEKIEAIKTAEKETKLSKQEFFGNIKDKIEVVVKFVKSAGFSTQFGYTYVYTFIDSENHTFVWKTGTYMSDEALKGADKITLKGTIKEHKEYGETKQTVLTRCKLS